MWKQTGSSDLVISKVAVALLLPTQKYRRAQVNVFYDQLIERATKLPGVKSVAGIYPLPLSNSNVTTRFVVEGAPFVALSDRPDVGERVITPGYFQTMSIPILKGRSFNEQGRDNRPSVIIVNQALASRCWPYQDAVGKRLGFEDDQNNRFGARSSASPATGSIRLLKPQQCRRFIFHINSIRQIS